MNDAVFLVRVAAKQNGRLRLQFVPSFGCRLEVFVGHRKVVFVRNANPVGELEPLTNPFLEIQSTWESLRGISSPPPAILVRI